MNAPVPVLAALTRAQLRGRLSSVGGPYPQCLSKRIPRGLVRVTFYHGDGTIYNRFDLNPSYLAGIEQNAKENGRVFRRSRNVAYVQACAGADWPTGKKAV